MSGKDSPHIRLFAFIRPEKVQRESTYVVVNRTE